MIMPWQPEVITQRPGRLLEPHLRLRLTSGDDGCRPFSSSRSNRADPGWRDRSGCICGCIRSRSVGPGSGHARADDLPIQLGRSPLIARSTTLKASGGQPPGGSNPSASAAPDQQEYSSAAFLGLP